MAKILGQDTVHMHGVTNNIDFNVLVPARVEITSARIKFDYRSSSILDETIARLTFWLNGLPIGQAQLKQATPAGVVSVDIPPTLLKSGNNDMRVSYTLALADNSEQKDYWLTLNAGKSTLTATFNNKILPAALNTLPKFVFAPNQAPATINFVLPTFDNQTLKAVFNLAADIAIVYPKTKVAYSVSLQPVTDADNFIIQYAATPPQIKIKSNTNGWEEVLITVANPQGLKNAGSFFMNPQLPYLAQNTFPLDGANIVPDQSSAHLLNNTTLTLGELGFTPAPFLWQSEGQKLVFDIPSDIVLDNLQKIYFSFNYNYTAGFDRGSAIKIDVNDGLFISALPLFDANGGAMQKYKVQMPSDALRQGANKIIFTPLFNVKDTNPNAAQFLQAQVLADSSIKFPAFDSFVVMPDITALMIDGFPFNNGAGLSIKLLNKDPQTISAALNFFARMNLLSIKRIAANDIDDTPALTQAGNILIVSSQPPPQNIAAAIPALNMPAAKKQKLPLRIKFAQKYFKLLKPSNFSTDFRIARQQFMLENKQFILSLFANPQDKKGTVLFIGAGSNDILDMGVKNIFTVDTRNKIAGDSALLDFEGTDSPFTVSWTELSPKYALGKISFLIFAYSLFKHNTWLITIAVLGLIFIMAALIKNRFGQED